jgi:hypothetical protein
MVYHGVLLRDGFRRAEGGLNLQRLPSEQELAPKRTKSTEQADVTVVGESLTGQVLKSKKHEQMRLGQVGRGLVRVSCWSGISADAVSCPYMRGAVRWTTHASRACRAQACGHPREFEQSILLSLFILMG